MMRKTKQQFVSYLTELTQDLSTRKVVGLVGTPGSGKSTFVDSLVIPNLVCIGMDGFHFSKVQLNQFDDVEQAYARRGAPWTFDAKACVEKVKQLKSAYLEKKTVYWPGFEHSVGDPVVNAHTIASSAPVILIEGLYLLHQSDGWQELNSLLDSCWYLDVPIEIAQQRLISRHMAAWGMTLAQATARAQSNDFINADLVRQTQPLATGFVSP